MKPHLGVNQSATYQIQVQGCVPDHWLTVFEGWQAAYEAAGDVTTLSGPVADQAALHGLLQALYAVGLPILAVQIQ